MSGKNQNQHSEGIKLGDIYYVLFRQKWIIIAAVVLAFISAIVVCVMKPPQFQSEAELLIRYVVDKSLGPADNDVSMRSPERGDTIIDTEEQILTSLDLAQQVVQDVGASNILAKAGGGDDTNAAAGLIIKSLTIDPLTKGSVIHVDFQNPDPDVAQSVLREIIRNYYKKHAQMHQAVGVFGDFLAAETRRLRTELGDTEKQLKAAKDAAGIISLDEAKKSAIEQITKVREDILSAEAELAEHRAILTREPGTPQSSKTNATDTVGGADIPEAEIREYKNVCLVLAQDTKQEQDAIVVQGLREDSFRVLEIRDQIAKDENAKKKLEQKFPGLTTLLASIAPASSLGQTSPGGIDLAAESAHVRMLEGKTNRLHIQLAQIRAEASKLEDAEEPIQELQRQKDLKEANLRHFLSSLEQSRIDEELGQGKGSGEISVVENPTPPIRKRPKAFNKLLGMTVGGCLAGGIGLAFLIEMFFDHTVRRPVEVERKLKLPLFVSIPDMNQKGRNRSARVNGKAPLLLRESNGEALAAPNGNGVPGSPGAAENPSWDYNHALDRFYAGLRERLIVNFEVRNLTHNPKLVAVTSCGKGAGVSSVAAGLAASLSETGDGNVLLVDMNVEQHSARQFYKGKPGCGLDAALEAETMGNAMVSENLYVASEHGDSEKLPRVLPKRFASLMPKLKASDYDYIIFDMPPVSQTSMTPRLAGLMDMVLLVIESEKTSLEAVQHASALLAESKATVSTVLNKTRSYVPARLHHDFLNDA